MTRRGQQSVKYARRCNKSFMHFRQNQVWCFAVCIGINAGLLFWSDAKQDALQSVQALQLKDELKSEMKQVVASEIQAVTSGLNDFKANAGRLTGDSSCNFFCFYCLCSFQARSL